MLVHPIEIMSNEENKEKLKEFAIAYVYSCIAVFVLSVLVMIWYGACLSKKTQKNVGTAISRRFSLFDRDKAKSFMLGFSNIWYQYTGLLSAVGFG